jgi:hypothetical protein
VTPWARQQADRLRALPLPAVLAALGATPDRHDGSKWHTAAGVLSVNGAKFINWSRGQGGGGAIDLVMQVLDLRFAGALAWLERHCTGARPPHSTTLPSRPAGPAAVDGSWLLPPPHPRHLARVKGYLTEQRGIDPAMIDRLVASGVLYADARANAVFVLLAPREANRPVGAELRGTGSQQWRGLARGSRKDSGCFSVGGDPFAAIAPIVLCESAIDAISCALLHPGFCCLSTSGARPNPAWLAALTTQPVPIHCGFDADATGDLMAAEMLRWHPRIKRLRPARHDWNDVLTSRSSPLPTVLTTI